MNLIVCERPMSKRNDESVRVESDVVRKARLLAADTGIPLAQFLTDILRPIVEQRYAAFIARESQGTDKPRR